MRDPQRIRPLLVRLLWAWQTCPDLRLGQLIMNSCSGDSEHAAYYLEDEELLARIEFQTANRQRQ